MNAAISDSHHSQLASLTLRAWSTVPRSDDFTESITATGRVKHSQAPYVQSKDRYWSLFCTHTECWAPFPVAMAAKGAAATVKLGPGLQASSQKPRVDKARRQRTTPRHTFGVAQCHVEPPRDPLSLASLPVCDQKQNGFTKHQ